mgnify:CR=1 FL=1
MFDQVIGKLPSFPITGSVIKHELSFMFYQLTSDVNMVCFHRKQKPMKEKVNDCCL